MLGALLQPLIDQRDRWALWLPVALAIGVGVYFALPDEPPPWLGATSFLSMAVVAWIARDRTSLLIPALIVATMAGGFFTAQIAALRAEAPVVERRLGPLRVEGRVVAVEAVTRGQRVMLDQIALPGETAAPSVVRLTLGTRAAPVLPGDRISVAAILYPPPDPVLPGGFDFARQAWFDGIGAVGFSVGRVEQLPPGETELYDQARLWLAGVRRHVTERLTSAVPGDAGAVLAALITGERGGVSRQVWDSYRDSGLAHLLAISGLHMSMVAGLFFVFIRGGLALIPQVALRFPIKKWTALAALAGAFGYLMLAGAPVPTQRAFIMISIVLLAVLADRTAISMRNVAWAAMAVLMLQPEALVGASFQMSFAAVIALVAFYEAAATRMVVWRGEGTWRRGILLYVGGIAATTLVAGTATGFYAAFHFSRFASWSLAANLAAVPITGLVTMPFGLCGLLLMPLGLEAWPLRMAGYGIEAVNSIAAAVSQWPAAAMVVPAPPVAALVLFSLGGLWCCLWRGRLRYFGAPAVMLALLFTSLNRPPDVLVDSSAALMAVRAADGGLLMSTERGSRLVREVWLERAGGSAPPRPFQAASDQDGLSCDSLGCLYRRNGYVVALAQRPEALVEDCLVATVAISAAPLRHACPAARLVVDRFSVWRAGAHAIWLDGAVPRVTSVREWQGRRPWARWPGRHSEDQPGDGDGGQ